MVLPDGLEPSLHDYKSRVLTFELQEHLKFLMELAIGLEPTTFALQVRRSTSWAMPACKFVVTSILMLYLH